MSNETLNYKGYFGSIEADIEDGILHGELLWIKDTVAYEGETLPELKENFQGAVDEYLEFCAETGIEPDKTFSGTIQIRLGPDLHKQCAIHAHQAGLSLNKYIVGAVELRLSPDKTSTYVHEHHHHHVHKPGFAGGWIQNLSYSEDGREWQRKNIQIGRLKPN